MRQRDRGAGHLALAALAAKLPHRLDGGEDPEHARMRERQPAAVGVERQRAAGPQPAVADEAPALALRAERSEEHTSEHQSLMRISYAVVCLKKKKNKKYTPHQND